MAGKMKTKAQKTKNLFFFSDDIWGIEPFVLRIEFNRNMLYNIVFNVNYKEDEVELKMNIPNNVIVLKYTHSEEITSFTMAKETYKVKIINELVRSNIASWFVAHENFLNQFYNKAKDEKYYYELTKKEYNTVRSAIESLVDSIGTARHNPLLKDVLSILKSDSLLKQISYCTIGINE